MAFKLDLSKKLSLCQRCFLTTLKLKDMETPKHFGKL